MPAHELQAGPVIARPKVLVIGAGVMASVFCRELSRNFDLYLSFPREERLYFQSLNNAKAPLAYMGLGGLGKYWHSVLNFEGIHEDRLKDSKLATHILPAMSPVRDARPLEFIPFRPYRPWRFNRVDREIKVVDATRAIEFVSTSKVVVRFANDKTATFDFVFCATGGFTPLDPLLASSIAKDAGTLGDHIVFACEDGSDIDHESTKLKFSLKGHLRPYTVKNVAGTEVKKTLRPTENKNRASHTKKQIYSSGKSNLGIALELLLTRDLNAVRQALHLRYGLPYKTDNFETFGQVLLPQAFKVAPDGTLKSNADAIDGMISNLAAGGVTVDRGSVASGIHFNSRYQGIDSSVSVNAFDNEKLLHVVTPHFALAMDSCHFTFKLMLIAEQIAQGLTKKYDFNNH